MITLSQDEFELAVRRARKEGYQEAINEMDCNDERKFKLIRKYVSCMKEDIRLAEGTIVNLMKVLLDANILFEFTLVTSDEEEK